MYAQQMDAAISSSNTLFPGLGIANITDI